MTTSIVKYWITIEDEPEKEYYQLTAQVKVTDDLTYVTGKKVNKIDLASANYNLMAATICTLTGDVRRLVEKKLGTPVIQEINFNLPEGWETYQGPKDVIHYRERAWTTGNATQHADILALEGEWTVGNERRAD